MKNKKIAIISILVVIIIAMVIALVFLLNKPKTIEITFNSDGGTAVETIKIKKGDSIKLPSVTKEGFTFLGWYMGDIRVSDSTTFNENKELLAKWVGETVKTFTITFDSDGGSDVDKLIVECGKELTLPESPTKTGYEFVSWIDKNETPILDKALLECSDITLKANWKKVEKKEETKKEDKKEEKKEPVYSCPTGYKLNGTKCEFDDYVREKCPDGTTADGNLCIKTSDSNSGNRVCKEDTVSIDGKGHTWTGKGDYYYIPNAYGSCAYYKWESYTTQSQCEQAYDINHKTKWVSHLNGCYAETKMNNYETVCSSDYQFYTSAELSSKFGIHDNGKCLKKVNKVKYCLDGWVLQDNDTRCVKTIDATVTNN